MEKLALNCVLSSSVNSIDEQKPNILVLFSRFPIPALKQYITMDHEIKKCKTASRIKQLMSKYEAPLLSSNELATE